MCRRFAALFILSPLFVLAADPPADKATDQNQPPLASVPTCRGRSTRST